MNPSLSPDFLKTLVADLSVHGVKYFEMTGEVVKISFFEPMPKLVEIKSGGPEVSPEDDMLFGGNPPPEYKKPPAKPSRQEMQRADPDSADWPKDE